METNFELLTQQFYAWEIRGRGLLLADYPCDLEPPFHPFFYHYTQKRYVDDGRRPTLLSSISDFVKGRKEETIDIPHYEEPPIAPFPFEDSELHAYTIVLPKGFKTPMEQTMQLLTMFSHCRMPLSYEISASQDKISIHLVCRIEDVQVIRGQCKAYFPEVTLHDDSTYINSSLPPDTLTGIVDFILLEECTRPIHAAKSFDLDPYISFFGILEHLHDDERVLLQIQFTPTANAWADSMLKAVSDNRGDCFFLDAPEMLPLAKEKVSAPLYAVVIKLAVQAKSESKVLELVRQVSYTICTLSKSASNRLEVRDDTEYSFQERFGDIADRQSHRLGMLLNVRELATLVHFPSHSIHSDKLLRLVTRTKAAPALTKGYAYVLGLNVHQNKEQEVSVSEQQRMRHMHLIGTTGTGKSTLLLNLINQDIQRGNGCAVLDPHGDLIETILTIIPEHRKHDVVVIDPFDTEYPIACNLLYAKTDIEKELISSDLVALFRRFSTSWGDQMNSVFANAILAFVESTKGGTLVDLQRFLIEKSFRDEFLSTVTDERIVYYWQKEFPLLKSSSIGPILTRLDAFLRPKIIRNMVSQQQSLPIAEFMDTKKIVLIKLSQGLIGAENSYLLGALLVSKIHQAAMARQLRAKDDRTPFYLYIDEFQHFITPSMSEILSGARKYNLGLILAHQSMEQVIKYDSELAGALLANAGTRICFRLGNADAKKLEDGFSYFNAEDLQNLSIGEAIVRINRSEDDFSLRVEQQDFSVNLQIVRDDILKQSRRKYASPIKRTAEQQLVPGSEITAKPIEEKQAAETTVPPKEPEKEEKKTTVKSETEVEIIGVKDKKEQSEHRSLQMMIKLMAEGRGFKASLEVPTVDNGKVDVVLEKGGLRIACEVSVTTDVAWEMHNIKKCLKDNFSTIISVSKNHSFIIGMQKKAVEVLAHEKHQKLFVASPEELVSYLDTLDVKETASGNVKGYRVKVQYGTSVSEENNTKRELLSKMFRFKKG